MLFPDATSFQLENKGWKTEKYTYYIDRGDSIQLIWPSIDAPLISFKFRAASNPSEKSKDNKHQKQCNTHASEILG